MRIIENKMIKKISKEKKRLIIGATGASGIPVLQKCLELIKEEEDYESWLASENERFLDTIRAEP